MLSETGKEGNEKAIRELCSLLVEPDIESAVRRGDIFGAMVDYYAANENFKTALSTLQEMKNKLPKVFCYFMINCILILRLFV